MSKVIFRLMAVTLFSISLFSAVFAQGGTITIQGQAGTFPTIQAAINAAQPNNAVLVDGGDHPENLLITKPIRVTGLNNAALDPATGTPVTVINPAGPVHINGFTIRIPSGQIGVNYDGLATDPNNTGTVQGCVFLGGGKGIFAKEANFRIVANQFGGFSTIAIQVSGNSGNTSRQIRISSNTVNGNSVVHGQFLAFTSAIAVSDGNLQVDGNQITNVFRGLQAIGCAGKVASNVFTNAALGMDFTSSPNLLVELNSSTISSVFSAAVNTQQSTTFALRLIGSNSVTVSHNTFVGGNFGIICTSQSINTAIDSNIVSGTFSGFQGGGIGMTFTLDCSAEVHNNNIENNANFGISMVGSTIINAINNWWGAANGPSGVASGSGDAVSFGVTFAPFLTVPNPNAGV